MPEALVSLPVYNEAARLETTVSTLVRNLPPNGVSYRFAVAEDGSTDGTKRVLERLTARFPTLLSVIDSTRRGRGYALRRLWSSADADIYCYADVDLPAGTEAIERVISAVHDGADVATASRYCPRATVTRPPAVRAASEGYNWLIRTVFGDGIADHQCGIKAFSRQCLRRLLPAARDNSWFWDTEMLILAKRSGMRVVEVPVDWHETRNRRTSFRRLASEIPYFLARIVELGGRLSTSEPSLVPAPAGVPGAVEAPD
jgi:glycosyltransferase involved in cell wall biosynthesis